MNINKLLTLIGSILLSVVAGFQLLVLLAIGFLASSAAGNGDMGALAGGAVWTVIFLVTAACTVLAWLAFVKLEGENAQTWRVILLVIGILTIFDLFAGVLFILAFALKPATTAVAGHISEPVVADGFSEVASDAVVIETSDSAQA